MRDPEPLDPEVAAALEAIDATLLGDPVDPELAELAELSLILRDERPRPDETFLAELDRRAAGRFDARPTPRSTSSGGRRSWGVATALAGVAAIIVALILVLPGGGGGAPRHATASGAVATSTVSSSASAAASAGRTTSRPAATSSAHGPAGPAPTPRGAPGRDLAQTAQLSLRARAGDIDTVAQQLYDVVGAERGYVVGSHVSARSGGVGDASFTLKVPSSRLQATLQRLSTLRDAAVLSRADDSSDITGTVNATAARLATAQALRRSLLRRLAAADTATEAGQVQAALTRDEMTITGDSSELAHLRATVSDSAISVTLTAPPALGSPRGGRRAGGFTLHRALHDAGRILVVAAGVALIALAVVVPLGLLVALGAWGRALTRRRRREAALDR